MRVNVYAEEMTNEIEVIEKVTKDGAFTSIRFYLALPVTFVNSPIVGLRPATIQDTGELMQFKGKFIHHKGDDDSGAVTFWGKRDLREVLRKALDVLDKHYAARADREFGQPHHGHDEHTVQQMHHDTGSKK